MMEYWGIVLRSPQRLLPVEGLIDKVKSYNENCDEDSIRRAYDFGKNAHEGQKRASGEPYFAHPVEVAYILASKFLDDASIIAGLLHDTVEDTDVELPQIQMEFGDDVASLVDGLTKLSMVYLDSQEKKQAENFRKLLMALSKDIRVLLVKSADRLHNMRTLQYVPRPEKRKRIARETLEVYVPLVERVGINDWKEELQGLSFYHLHQDMHDNLEKKLSLIDEKLVDDMVGVISDTMVEYHVDSAEVYGRKKRPYSIWQKMQKRAVSFDQMSDVIAFRILVEDEMDLYKALGAVHGKFRVIPGRFKDYVSLPKANGYQSIHTGVLGPNSQRIEIQMRTRQMHRVAELGVASHWSYKQGASGAESDHEGMQYSWVRTLLEVVENTQGSEEFLEHTKLEMYKDSVFVFTPKGDLINLPKGGTALDFAYHIHSDVGNKCNVARINGAIVPLNAKLKTGDIVAIETSKTREPSADWEKTVVSGKAKAYIRRYLRTQKREEFLQQGQGMVEEAFEPYNLTEAGKEKAIKSVLPQFECETAEDLLVYLGEGRLQMRDVLFAAIPESKQREEDRVRPESFVKRLFRRSRENEQQAKKKIKDSTGIKGLVPGLAVKYGKCCHPIPGDRICGIVASGTAVTIHTDTCDVVKSLQDQPERFLDVSWENDATEDKFVGRLNLYIANQNGALTEVTGLIGRHENAEIHNIKVLTRTPDYIEIILDTAVPDVAVFNNIVGSLRACPIVGYVDRNK